MFTTVKFFGNVQVRKYFFLPAVFVFVEFLNLSFEGEVVFFQALQDQSRHFRLHLFQGHELQGKCWFFLAHISWGEEGREWQLDHVALINKKHAGHII